MPPPTRLGAMDRRPASPRGMPVKKSMEQLRLAGRPKRRPFRVPRHPAALASRPPDKLARVPPHPPPSGSSLTARDGAATSAGRGLRCMCAGCAGDPGGDAGSRECAAARHESGGAAPRADGTPPCVPAQGAAAGAVGRSGTTFLALYGWLGSSEERSDLPAQVGWAGCGCGVSAEGRHGAAHGGVP